MSEKSVAFEYCDKMVEDFEKVIGPPSPTPNIR